MILVQKQNTPATAPQFSDMDAALGLYQTFIDDGDASMADFVEFAASPSTDRDAFLELFTADVENETDIYIQVTYGIE